MAKTPANSPLNSLRGKIWIAAIIFAVVLTIYRLITFLIVSLVAQDPLYTIFLPFVFVVLAVLVFGWWLSNEIVRPIEKVSLLAKSFERGLPTTPPKSSGAAETDDLLQTLYRISQQTHKLVAAMDDVAGGNLDAARAPETNSDRLTQTFQKMLLKVSESIHAKQDLENLQNSLARLSEDLAPVRRGTLDAKIKADAPETDEIVQVLNYLIEHLGETIVQVKSGSEQARSAGLEIQRTIRAVVERGTAGAAEMARAAAALRQAPGIIHQISGELSQSSQAALQSIEKSRRGSEAAQENLKAAGALRRQAQEAAKRIAQLRERSQDINRIAKTIDDLSHRASMLALNASVQANESTSGGGSGGGGTTAATAAGRSFVVISEEVGRLAERARESNKQISSLSQTLQAEIGEAESSLRAAIGEAANLSRLAIETGGALGESEKYIASVLNLQNKIAAASRERGEETERAIQIFAGAISESENSLTDLKESIGCAGQIAAIAEDLHSLAMDFKVAKGAPEIDFKISAAAPVSEIGNLSRDLTSYAADSPLPQKKTLVAGSDASDTAAATAAPPLPPPIVEEDYSYNILGE